jgi:hypothetical protein
LELTHAHVFYFLFRFSAPNPLPPTHRTAPPRTRTHKRAFRTHKATFLSIGVCV